MNICKKSITALTFIVLPVLCLPSHAKNWSFQVEPYLLATTIEGDAGIGRIENTPVEVDFNTILDNLELGAMIHAEALHKSGWGVAVHYAFMDLASKKSADDKFAKVKIHQGVLEALGIYRVKYKNDHIDYIAGIRWWDNDIDLSFNAGITDNERNLGVSEDWVDVVAGVRWGHKIDNNWDFVSRVDVGGFGLSADFTSTVEAGINYKISKLMVLDVRYKATWVDFEDNKGTEDYFKYDTLTHGPLLGLSFNF